jgi:hypothetical protein
LDHLYIELKFIDSAGSAVNAVVLLIPTVTIIKDYATEHKWVVSV